MVRKAKFESTTVFFLKIPGILRIMEMISWQPYRNFLKRLNVIDVNSENCVKLVKIFSDWILFNTRTFSSRIMTWELKLSKNVNFLTSNFDILHFNDFHNVCVFLPMRKWSRDKVYVTISKFSVHFRHIIRCFYLHYVVLCLANVKINTLLAYFYGIWKVSFSQEIIFWFLGLSFLVCAPATQTRRL